MKIISYVCLLFVLTCTQSSSWDMAEFDRRSCEDAEDFLRNYLKDVFSQEKLFPEVVELYFGQGSKIIDSPNYSSAVRTLNSSITSSEKLSDIKLEAYSVDDHIDLFGCTIEPAKQDSCIYLIISNGITTPVLLVPDKILSIIPVCKGDKSYWW